ncbi:MAG: sensor histidine kinase [Thermoleophilaceae bacterium]
MRLPIAPERTPLESRAPILGFAAIRALIAVAAIIALAILGFPYQGTVTAVVAAAALPWALFVYVITRHSIEAGLNPLIGLGDMAVLGLLIAVEPDMYAPAHFTALFLVAAHAHCQGAHLSFIVGVLPPLVLIPITIASDVPVEHNLLHASEVVFAVASLSTALVVGAMREAESSARIRARALSRRTIDTESSTRRRLAVAIHDGPIQELTSVELMLTAAEQALARGDEAAGLAALTEARSLTRSNIGFLRDEVVELGPYAFEELSFEEAIVDCAQLWERRFGFKLSMSDIDADDLAPEIAGPLFRITQEAVTNAGKHAEASTVAVRLHRDDRHAYLEIEDDGRGFRDVDPLGPAEPGHIGLASMRERAEMLGGELAIQSSDSRTLVRVRVPL